MSSPRLPGRLRGLPVQIVLWTIVPATVLALTFMLTGVREHQRSMRAMVASRDLEVVQALAGRLSAELERYSAMLGALAAAATIPPRDLEALVVAVERELPGLELVVIGPAGEVLAGSAAALIASEVAVPAADGPTLAPAGDALLWHLAAPAGAVVQARLPVTELPLDRLLPLARTEPASGLVLTDGEKIIFAQGAPVPSVSALPGVVEALSGVASVSFVAGAEGGSVVASAPVQGVGWALVLQEPWLPLVASLLQFDRVTAFVLLMAGATSVLTLFFGVRHIVVPLRSLARRAGRIGEGDFGAASEPVGGVEEIEDLRRTLDEMAGRLGRYQTALEDQLAAQVRAQEEERARLARELHDETVQSLIALSQQAQMAQRHLARDPASAGSRLQTLRDMVSETIEEVRRFSQALRPLYLEDLGLAPALELLAHESGAQFRLEGDPRRLAPERELALYRVAQEALNNARRHSGATRIEVALDFVTDGVNLVVRDNGSGFEVPPHLSQLARRGHFGLLTMQERAQLVGGDLQVRAYPGAGTTITLSVPYEPQ
ncbi:MAG: HAMP domain-containing protein [Anaerolineae bacterium]|nr:HAMP domain-containing protein [Anaerolineae bacterium]